MKKKKRNQSFVDFFFLSFRIPFSFLFFSCYFFFFFFPFFLFYFYFYFFLFFSLCYFFCFFSFLFFFSGFSALLSFPFFFSFFYPFHLEFICFSLWFGKEKERSRKGGRYALCSVDCDYQKESKRQATNMVVVFYLTTNLFFSKIWSFLFLFVWSPSLQRGGDKNYEKNIQMIGNTYRGGCF